jgi:hypothetical protein
MFPSFITDPAVGIRGAHTDECPWAGPLPVDIVFDPRPPLCLKPQESASFGNSWPWRSQTGRAILALLNEGLVDTVGLGLPVHYLLEHEGHISVFKQSLHCANVA